jgi:hypothetical protein
MIKKIFKKFKFYILPVAGVFAFVKDAFAENLKDAGNILGQIGSKAGTSSVSDPGKIVGTVINVALTLVGIIFLSLMVYAGYLWMTARGETDKVEEAKKIITAAIIGIAIVLSAYAITALVTAKFGAL